MEQKAKYGEDFTFLRVFDVSMAHKRGQVASRGLGRAEGRFLGWLTVIERYQRQWECGARPDTEISLFVRATCKVRL